MMSFSGHKIYGPKGMGGFFIKTGTPFKPQVFGGHQQSNVRPGTYNVPGIVGLGKAVEIVSDTKHNKQENRKIKELRDYLIDGVKSKIKNVIIRAYFIKFNSFFLT